MAGPRKVEMPRNNIVRADFAQKIEDVWPQQYSVDGHGPDKMCYIQLGIVGDAYIGRGEECDVLDVYRRQAQAEFKLLDGARKRFREVMDGIKTTAQSSEPLCYYRKLGNEGIKFTYNYNFFSESACKKAQSAYDNLEKAEGIFEKRMRDVGSKLGEHVSAHLERLELHKMDEYRDYIKLRQYCMSLESAMPAGEFEKAVDHLLRKAGHEDPSKASFPERYEQAQRLGWGITKAAAVDPDRHEGLVKQAIEELKEDPDFVNAPTLFMFYKVSLRVLQLDKAE